MGTICVTCMEVPFNTGFAKKTGGVPFMEASWDFERLYTHIPWQNLKDSTMHVMTLIFECDRRQNIPRARFKCQGQQR